MRPRPDSVRRARLVATLAAIVVLAGSGVSAAEPTLEVKLSPATIVAADRFGYAVDMIGDQIVVGAPGTTGDQGAAFVYDVDDTGAWNETMLTASDGDPGDWFGRSIAVADGLIVVGAPFSNRGSAYLFEADGAGGWTETRLRASDGARNDLYGYAVGAATNTVVVGAIRNDNDGTPSGSIYVYERTDGGRWSETKLAASDGASGDQFGIDVAVTSERIAVGAGGTDVGDESNAGAVYLFDRDGGEGWLESKLTASDATAGDQFGGAVDLAGDRVVVGAMFDDEDEDEWFGDDEGSVYVFDADRAGGWSETKIRASDGRPEQYFGNAVALADDMIVVGNNDDDEIGGDSGAAYVYELDAAGDWNETKLKAGDARVGAFFGWSVAAQRGRMAVGSLGAPDTDPGSVYVFTTAPTCLGRAATITGTGLIVGTAGPDVIVGSSGNDRIDAGGGDDLICGGSGDDILIGRAGDDILVGGQGADDFRGGPGLDTVDYSGSDGGVRVALNLTADDGRYGEGDHVDLGVENVVGSRFSDTILGNDHPNVLAGGEGRDRIWGRGGDDEIHGGSGNDWLVGGPGSDVLRGGDGFDYCRGSAQLDFYFHCERTAP